MVRFGVAEALESGFEAVGVAVCRRPWTTVAICLALTAAAGLPLLIVGLRREGSPFRLWVPPESRFASDTRWLASRFGAVVRPQRVLVVAPNVLRPAILVRLKALSDRIEKGPAPYDRVCFEVPSVPAAMAGFDPTGVVSQRTYCRALSVLSRVCLRSNPIDAWNGNVEGEAFANLSSEAIAAALESAPAFPESQIAALGGIERNEEGTIVGAKALLLTWYVRVNFSAVDEKSVGNDAGTEEWTSAEALDWEAHFLEELRIETENAAGDERLHYEAGRSFGDASGGVMFRDAGKLAVGIAMMTVYIQLILSRRSWVETRLTLGSVGLLCVGLALVVSCSLCSTVGVPYGPVHNSLPFLLMGLGVDDMFVMKACWESQTEAETRLPTPERVGLMLRRAGISVAVTSFTDIVAFLVGAITVLPSLQSFCLYAAAGVFFIFVFSVTFYVAIFALDLKRMEEKRNGVLFCIRHPEHVPSPPGRKSASRAVLHALYSKVIFKRPVQIFILTFAVAVSGFSLVAVFELEQRFDPTWFVPEDSYYHKYLSVRREYFPNMGYEGSVFVGAVDYVSELPKIYNMVEALKNETDIFQNLNSWTVPFRTYLLRNEKIDVLDMSMTDLQWRSYLSKFLHSPSGGKYQLNFRFDGELICGEPAPRITVSSVDFTFRIFKGPEEYLPAKRRIERIVDSANFTTGEKFATVWSKIFANWVTDEVIQVEVERNLELALICVMVCTLILIADIQICFWIFTCVLLTLINVCGWMHRWGLTIDIVSCVGLELGIGFCVDYAAHIGHTFLTVQGSRRERALETVTSMGAAVLYGGGSTLLSLSVLSVSETYIFQTFFKIFLLVILFGLFNGLLFLPVVLSLIGPRPHRASESNENQIPLDDQDKGTQMRPLNCDPEL